MQNGTHCPVIATGGRHVKLAAHIKKQCDRIFVRFFIAPLLILIPSAFAGAYSTSDEVKKLIAESFPSFTVWLDGHLLFLFSLSIGYIYLMGCIYAAIDHVASRYNPLNIEIFAALNYFTEAIVSAKASRFGLCAKTLLEPTSRRIDWGEVFGEVTQPALQFEQICKAIRSFFIFLAPGHQIRVNIVRVASESPVEWVFFDPPSLPPTTSIKTLARPSSVLCNAIKNKKMYVIENVASDAHKTGNLQYVTDDGSDSRDKGCLICYPIKYAYHGEFVPYVINISCVAKGVFKNDDRDLYEWILDRFSLRIGLEHSLDLLKREVPR